MITKKEINYTISLIKSGISGGFVEEPPADLDWNGFYTFNLYQKTTSLIYFSISRLPETTKQNIPILKQLFAVFKESLYFDANRQAEATKLSQLFSHHQVDYVFLKGYVTKNLYPDTSLRTMGDTDILYRANKQVDMEKLMKTAGYNLKRHTPKDDAYLNPICGIYVELHRHLIDKGYKTEYHFLENIWERLIPKNEHEYIMSDEDFYLYHIIHMAKHVRHSGIGFTHFIDLWLYILNYPNMNLKYINDSLEKLQLTSFEKYSRMLACRMFYTDASVSTALVQNPKDYSAEDSNVLDLFFNYMYRSGSFGNLLQMEVNSIVMSKKQISTPGVALVKRIFPDKTTMINYYGDIIEKYPWLIPVYWIYLNMCRLFSKERSLSKQKKLMDNIADKHVEATKTLMDNLFH